MNLISPVFCDSLSAQGSAARLLDEYHQMKIDFILTARMLLSNLWDTFESSLGMFPNNAVEVLYRARFDRF